MAETPAGWYDDGHGALRYWDGVAWTEHEAPVPFAEPQYAAAVPPRRRRVWPWVLGAVAAVVVIGGVAAGILAVTALANRSTAEPTVTPRDTVMIYNTAWNSQDCALANSVTVAELDYDDCSEFVDDTSEYTDYKVTIMNDSITDSTAQVTTSESYHYQGGVQVEAFTYLLENHGGVWLISGTESD